MDVRGAPYEELGRPLHGAERSGHAGLVPVAVAVAAVGEVVLVGIEGVRRGKAEGAIAVAGGYG